MKTTQTKNVLITGGSSGIGLAIARQLFNQGNSVFILARDEIRLKEAHDTIEKTRVNDQQKTDYLSVDITDTQILNETLNRFVGNFGLPDLLINAAGVARPGYVETLDSEIFRWTMDINFLGTVNVNQFFLPALILRGSGHIVNFSSLAGVLGIIGYTAYSGSKFAVRGYSDALRHELKPKGIKVSIVFPPDTDTPQLAWEHQYKPFETRVIGGSDKPLSAEQVARAVISGIEQGKYNIVPGFEANLIYFLATRLGGAVNPILDVLLKSAIKKKMIEHQN